MATKPAMPGNEPPVAPQGTPLVVPIQRGETAIDRVQVRKPQSGELRGLSLLDLIRLDVDALHTVLPRITIPTLTEQEVSTLDPQDLINLGTEVAGFFTGSGSPSA